MITTSSSNSNCNWKCEVDSLQRPMVSGNFTALTNLSDSQGYYELIVGGISNFGTRNAFNVNMTLYWTITYPDRQLQQTLGTFNLGNIAGRNTQPFTDRIPYCCTLDFHIDVVNATFVWAS